MSCKAKTGCSNGAHGHNRTKELNDRIDNLVLGFDAIERLTQLLYDAVQSGAGCCGKGIGRGTRLRQVLDEIQYQRKQPGRPQSMSDDWLPPAEAEKLRGRITELTDLIFELGEKGPHLMGCGVLGNGSYLCDDRCLVDKYNKLQEVMEEW